MQLGEIKSTFRSVERCGQQQACAKKQFAHRGASLAETARATSPGAHTKHARVHLDTTATGVRPSPGAAISNKPMSLEISNTTACDSCCARGRAHSGIVHQ